MKIGRKKKAIRRKRTSQSGPRYWVTVGTLAAYTAVTGKSSWLAYAQEARGTKPSPSVAQTLTVQRFDIPPGPLNTVLGAFRDATGIQAVMSNEEMGSVASPGVSGLYSAEQGLKQLLAGTGIGYRFSDPETVTLEILGPSESVVVTEEAPLSTPKYTEPLRDTPQTITVVPREVMQAQGTTTLRDALRNVAGISLAAGEGGAQGDNLTIRGFTARNDIFIDGMRDFGSYYRDPFNLEEIQVLQGPSSVMFGRGSTGGVVNLTTKTPQLSPFVTGTVDFGTDRTKRIAVDIDKPLPALGTGAAFRLSFMGHDSQVAGRDIAENRRCGIAPSLALGLGSPTRLTLSYFHQSADDTPDYGIPWLFNGPAPVRRENYYGFQNANFLRTSVDIGSAKFEHDFSPNITLRNELRLANYNRSAQITEARVPTTATPDTPLNAIAVNRGQIAVDSIESFFQDQLDVTVRFETGWIKHTLVAGVEAGRETSDPTRPTFTGVPVTSLLEPDTNQPFSGGATITSRVQTTAISFGAFAIDTLRLGEKWQLVGGARWDRFDADYKQFVPPTAAFQRVDTMPSWRGALVYKPKPTGSIYFGYGTSFNPSAESLSLSASIANIPPEKNKTYEVGTKWDLSSGRCSLRTALFRTEKTNAREPDPNNPLRNVLSGNQLVEGVEFEAATRLTSRWQIISSYAFLHSELATSQFYPAAVGSPLANVPQNTFNLWSQYQLPSRLEVGGGAQFVDKRTASTTAPFDPVTGLIKEVPGYWDFNAMAKYPLSERLDLQLNVYNLTNKYYFDQIHPGHIVPGIGRTALLGLNFRF